MVKLRDIERKDTVTKKSDNKTDTSNKQKYLEKKEYDRTLRKLQRLAEESEKEIEKLENQVKETEEMLNSENLSPERANDIFIMHGILKIKVYIEMEIWAKYLHDSEMFIQENS